MKQAHIQQIELELGVTLPKAYVDLMLHYPKDLRGPTAQKQLIHEPNRLVKVNRSVRAFNKRHRSKTNPWEWPEYLFVIGESDILNLNDNFEEEKCCYAIDLRQKRPMVLHISMVSGSGSDDPSFSMFTLSGFVRSIRKLDAADRKPTKSKKKRKK